MKQSLGLTLLLLAPIVSACDQLSEPSALDVAERQAEYEALSEEFDDYWFLEGKTGAEARFEHGFKVPEACDETIAEAQAREAILDNAMFLAIVDDDRGEVYDLWGQKIELLQQLDSSMKQGCP